MDIVLVAQAKSTEPEKKQKGKVVPFKQDLEVKEAVADGPDNPFHKKRYVGCMPYKSREVLELESAFIEFERQLYNSLVKNQRINHRWCRNALLKMYKLIRPIRKQLRENQLKIKPYAERVHPSWEGVKE